MDKQAARQSETEAFGRARVARNLIGAVRCRIVAHGNAAENKLVAVDLCERANNRMRPGSREKSAFGGNSTAR